MSTLAPPPAPSDGGTCTPLAVQAMGAEPAAVLASRLRALADPVRLRMLSLVVASPDGEACVCDLASVTDLSQPTVSHHLKVLKEAGLLTSERRGTWVHYSVAPPARRAVRSLFETFALVAASGDGVEESGAAPAGPALGDGQPALLDDEAVRTHVVDRLARRFTGLERGVVERVVHESWTALARTSRMGQHVPVLAERFARQRLEDLSRARSADARPQVLFVCVANAGRSQLAAALLRRYAGDAVVVRSAGSAPAEDVHDVVRPVLTEVLAGLPDDGAPFPKPLTDDALRAADVVVTMGCGDTCPVLPGKRYEDWAIADPALASPDGVREIRDEIDRRVRALADELLHRA